MPQKSPDRKVGAFTFSHASLAIDEAAYVHSAIKIKAEAVGSADRVGRIYVATHIGLCYLSGPSQPLTQMTEDEKQIYLGVIQRVAAILTPLVQAQKEQADAFTKQIHSMYPSGQPKDIVSHKAWWWTSLYLSQLQGAVQQTERQLQAHADAMVYLQNSDASTLTLEDILSMMDRGRLYNN